MKKEAKRKHAHERERVEKLELRKQACLGLIQTKWAKFDGFTHPAPTRTGRTSSKECQRGGRSFWSTPRCVTCHNLHDLHSLIAQEDSMVNLERTHNEKTQEEELEFEDEEQLAVVTVVEDFSADSLRHPNPPLPLVNEFRSPEGEKPGTSQSTEQKSKEKEASKAKSKLKAKSNKVRYETKAARKVERTKQRARKTEKAERAGGKQKRRAKR